MTVLAQLFIAVSLALLVACSPALFNIDTPPQDTSDGALRTLTSFPISSPRS